MIGHSLSPIAAKLGDNLGSDYELLGPIVRLQVQLSPLKQGEKPHRWYDPTPITEVPSLRIEEGGVVGLDGDGVLGDVHHRDHPLSRFRGENGISIGFTSHYTAMRNHFGDHLTDGIAGENIIVASDRVIAVDEVAAGVAIVTADGILAINTVEVAPPCAEFGKFCLRYDHDRAADRDVALAVRFLHQGTRGFYATFTGTDRGDVSSPPVSIGDLLYRKRSS